MIHSKIDQWAACADPGRPIRGPTRLGAIQCTMRAPQPNELLVWRTDSQKEHGTCREDAKYSLSFSSQSYQSYQPESNFQVPTQFQVAYLPKSKLAKSKAWLSTLKTKTFFWPYVSAVYRWPDSRLYDTQSRQSLLLPRHRRYSRYDGEVQIQICSPLIGR